MEYNGIQQIRPTSWDTWARWNIMMCSTSNLVTVRKFDLPNSWKSRNFSLINLECMLHLEINLQTQQNLDIFSFFPFFRAWPVPQTQWKGKPQWNSDWKGFYNFTQFIVPVQLYEFYLCRTWSSQCSIRIGDRSIQKVNNGIKVFLLSKTSMGKEDSHLVHVYLAEKR